MASSSLKTLLLVCLLSTAVSNVNGAWMTCAAVGAAGTIIGAPFVISAAGFGAGGVTSGSIAAAIQSSIGNVAAGSAFAWLQSAGPAGMGVLSSVGLGAVGGALTAAGGKIVQLTGSTGETLTYVCTALP